MNQPVFFPDCACARGRERGREGKNMRARKGEEEGKEKRFFPHVHYNVLYIIYTCGYTDGLVFGTILLPLLSGPA